MAHLKDNGIIYFDIHKSEPIDRRKKPTFQLIVRYHTFWIYEKFFDTEVQMNRFIERNCEEFYKIGRDIENKTYAYQQMLVRKNKEDLEYCL